MAGSEEELRMPSAPHVLGNASEAEFLEKIGLDLDRKEDRRVYTVMKSDARRGHQRICEDRSSLLPYLQNDRSVRPPFATTQITEGSLLREVHRTYEESQGKEVRALYDKGFMATTNRRDNWVIRWLLWQSFTSSGFGEEDEDDENGGDDGGSRDTGAVSASQGQTTSHYWDPVRD